jgi:glycosyltransferase involved in cell wall biosynthesis
LIRVLHVTEDHSFQNTGISGVVDAMTRSLPDVIRPAIACVGEETLPLRPGMALYSFPTHGLSKVWRFSAGQRKNLARAVAAADVIHIHGLWMWVQWAAAREAVSQKKPFVVTSHGMLEPWLWERQSWPGRLKKSLYWANIAYPVFRRAAVVHALTSLEAGTLASYFPGQKPEIIPNGIDLQAADQSLAGLPPSKSNEPPYFLFVGRLHPKKAIHLLIRAFGNLPENNFALKIVGPIEPRERAYAAMLRQLVTDLGLEQRVVFTGALQGPAKWQLYRDAWAFCLPSFSEGFSLVNLEAAAAATPVITTFEAGVVEDWDHCGGVRVHPEEESIRAGLNQALEWSPAERLARGRAMRELVENHYSWERVGQAWVRIYQNLSGDHAYG